MAATAAVLKDGAPLWAASAPVGTGSNDIPTPLDTKVNIKPVITNIVHTDTWEGPCRWRGISPAEERANAEAAFARWSKESRELEKIEGVCVLEAAHLTFCEDFKLSEKDLRKLAADCADADALYVRPAGSSLSAFEIGQRCGRPILLKGLGCRNVDIAAYCRSKGQEIMVSANDKELAQHLRLLRARKVFRQTKVLFPTNRGLPAACSIGSVWNLEGLQKRLGVGVKVISYQELADEMNRVLNSAESTTEAERLAADLLRRADKSFLDRKYVVKSYQFHRTVKNLMRRHQCNAFTIECFEFCSSRLPQQWLITPCLIHALLRNRGCASSCEADLGSLLAMRLLMSVAGKSCHQGNSDPKDPATFRINHSAPSMKMNGHNQPDLPYQLGRFVTQGWGTKVVLDFMNNTEKTVTVARVNPDATKLLVLRGKLTGSSGWGEDKIGCSVEAVIRPPEGRCDEFLRKRLEFGNHLQWVYGDYAEDMRAVGAMLGLEVEVIA